MQGLLYSAFDIAYVIAYADMGAKKTTEFLNWLWQEDFIFLHASYRYDKYKLVTDTYYWSDYLSDKQVIDSEFPAIKKDLESIGNLSDSEMFGSDNFDVDLFFKLLRLRILYINEKRYVRMKLRTLLREYGYKRRSDLLLQHLRDRLMFYHIQTYIKGGIECNICKVNLDETIIFRVV